MGLLSALNTAVTGLNVNQQNLNILSQNISNANTPGYSREAVNQQQAFVAGLPAGVTVTSVTRTVNEYLNTQMRNQTSNSNSASVVQTYYSQIQNLLGQPGGTNSIDQNINSFFTAVQNMANLPSISAQATVANTGAQVASSISGLATSLQGLRLQSDNDINSAVKTINADLQNLYSTNNALQHAAAVGENTAGLLDQRDSALADLSQYVDIHLTYQNDGEVGIATSSGVPLLTGHLSQLSYNNVASADDFTNGVPLSPILVTQLGADGVTPISRPIALATGGASSDVTTTLSSGKLQGLLSIRDKIIPSVLGQLDQLAANLRDAVNTIQNSGTSFPPPNSYTGTTELTGATTSHYSGSVRIAVLSSTGTALPSPYPDETNGVAPLTLDLGALSAQATGGASVDDIIQAINQYYGPPQNKVELGNLNNVQLGVISNTVPESGVVKFDFNLNNISSSNATFYITSASVYAGDPIANVSAGTVSTTGFSNTTAYATVGAGASLRTGSTANGPITATLNSNGLSASYLTVVANIKSVDSAGNVVTSQVTYQIPNSSTNTKNDLIGASTATADGTIVNPTSAATLATAKLVDANGKELPKTNGLYGNQRGYLQITANNSTQTIAVDSLDSKQLGGTGVTATNQGFSQYFGLNNFFNTNSNTNNPDDTLTNSAIRFSLTSRIANNPSLVSTGTLSQGIQPSSTTSKPNYTYSLASGDNSISQQMAALANSKLSFGSSGGLPQASTTLSQYAGQIIALTSANSANATSAMNNSQTLLDGYTTRAQAVSGVNVDQELANTVIYQNAYTASTRVITVISQLFGELMGMIQ